MKLTVQYRLTLIFTGLMAVLLLSINLMMYSLSSGFRKQNFFKSMQDRAVLVAISHKNKNYQPVMDEVLKNHIHRIFEAEDIVLEIGPEQTPKELAVAANMPLKEDFFREVLTKGDARLMIKKAAYTGVYFKGEAGQKDFMVLTKARDIEGNAYRKRLSATLLIAFIIAIITMGISSIVFSRRLFDPVVRFIQKVNNINAFNLNTRLEGENSPGEITELKNTVNDMLERIEAAFRAQQRFIGNTSHSLRTPLTVITGEAEIAMSLINQEHKAYYSLEVIMQETEKLKHIISTLLELAKTGTGKEKNNWQTIRIDELIRTIYQAIRKMDNRYNLKVDFNALPKDSDLLYINGNEYLLSLAISNIILNGLKYSNQNIIKIKAAIEGNNAVIKIIDKGIGIPKDELKQIFLPYFRASNTGGYDGFGIGLPLAMDIIRMHSGNIEVNSKVDVGTRVTVLLPLVNPYSPLS